MYLVHMVLVTLYLCTGSDMGSCLATYYLEHMLFMLHVCIWYL